MASALVASLADGVIRAGARSAGTRLTGVTLGTAGGFTVGRGNAASTERLPAGR